MTVIHIQLFNRSGVPEHLVKESKHGQDERVGIRSRNAGG
jgi:hypothetical protein